MSLNFNWFKKPKTTNVILGKMTIFEAGKALKVGNGHRFTSLTIQSIPKNTGMIFIGDVGVNIDRSIMIEPGDSISISDSSKFISSVYVTSDTSGSMVQYFGTGEKE